MNRFLEGGGLSAKGHKGTFWGDGNVLYLDKIQVLQDCMHLCKLIESYA